MGWIRYFVISADLSCWCCLQTRLKNEDFIRFRLINRWIGEEMRNFANQ